MIGGLLIVVCIAVIVMKLGRPFNDQVQSALPLARGELTKP
jgi:hypothetical protein